MNEIKIEKGIPLPGRNIGRPHAYKYPFREMQIGDSFAVASTKEGYHAASYGKRISGFTFACRTTANGARVWRIA
jgi:hypothetical protein